MNTKLTIQHPELVAVDGSDGKIYFGGRAQWLPACHQRHLRDGAVVAAEVLSYLAATRSSLWDLYPPRDRRDQADFTALAGRVWERFALDSKDQLDLQGFMDGLVAYLEHAGHTLVFQVLDIPADREDRPSADRCQGFVADALERDSPVAFLTRKQQEDGSVVCSWSLIVQQNGSRVVLADDGAQRQLDLRLWRDASTLGGALVFGILHPL